MGPCTSIAIDKRAVLTDVEVESDWESLLSCAACYDPVDGTSLPQSVRGNSKACTSGSVAPTTAITTAVRGENRVWRDRLASTKALLSVGTEAACREALASIEAFLCHVAEVELVATARGATTEDCAKATVLEEVSTQECRLCAQAAVLLLRTSTQQQTSQWRRSQISGMLIPSLTVCEACSAHAQGLQGPLISAGVLALLIPLLLTDSLKPPNVVLILERVLQIVCNLTPLITPQVHEQMPSLVAAILPLTVEVSSGRLSELAGRAIRLMARDEDTRAIVVSAGAIKTLATCCVRACSDGLCPHLAEEAVRALGNIALSDSFMPTIVGSGCTQSLLRLVARHTASPTRDAAFATLSTLSECPEARRIIVAEGGVSHVVAALMAPAISYSTRRAAGWVLVSISVDPELGHLVAVQGALDGLSACAQSEDLRLQEEAAWALANLSSVAANADAMTNSNVAFTLTTLLARSGRIPKVCLQTMWALANLAAHDAMKRRLAENGLVPQLTDLLGHWLEKVSENVQQPSPDAKRKAEPDAETGLLVSTIQQTLRVLANLAGEATNRTPISGVDGAGMALVIKAASTAHDVITEFAIRVLVNLTPENELAHLFVQLDGIQVLTAALARSDAPRVQQVASRLAINLSLSEEQALITDGVLQVLVELFDPRHGSLVQKHAAQVLCNLSAASFQNKMAIVKCGALRKLGRLIEHGRGSDEMLAASEAVMRQLAAALTPTSRRAMMQASMLSSHTVNGRETRALHRTSTHAATRVHRRHGPSPLAIFRAGADP